MYTNTQKQTTFIVISASVFVIAILIYCSLDAYAVEVIM
jgi:hypothetical protein